MRWQAKEQRHQKKKTEDKSATLGEAQMFMSMWKI